MNYNFVILLVGVVGVGIVAGKTTIAPEPTPDPNFKCPERDGLFAHPKDCTAFYECSDNVPWLFHCDTGLVWNQDIQMCDWPNNVNCTNGQRQGLSHPTRIQPYGQEIIGPGDYNCTDENGAFPHETLCDFYYDCWEGYASLGHCTEGHLFDLTYSGCNYPNQVNCGSRIRPNGTTNPPTTTKRTTTTKLPGTGPTLPPFECPEEDGLFPNPEECESFFHCTGGNPVFYECPKPLVFNPKTGACDYKDKVPGC